MAKERGEEGPVDLTKSKFSIDFLLENAAGFVPQDGLKYGAGTPDDCLSRSVSPDLDDESGDRAADSPSTSRHGHHHDERPKRPRTAFTGTQIKTLETEFEKNKYLSVVKRVELSKSLGLSQQQLKVWYQNRRTKWKRKYANDLESMAQQYYNSMGLAGSRPMLIGDRLWIFNSPHDISSVMRRGVPMTDGPASSLSTQQTLAPPALARSIPPFHPFSSLSPMHQPSFAPPLSANSSKSSLFHTHTHSLSK